MLTPGPDHPIATATNPRRVRIKAFGHVIGDSHDVLTLTEARLAPVQYFPREDIETGFLSKSPKVTECPYKGMATYYSMLIDGELIENVAWSYEAPYPTMEVIRGRLAFYPDKVEIYEVSEADLKAHHHPGSSHIL